MVVNTLDTDRGYLLMDDVRQWSEALPEGSILSRTIYRDERVKVVLFSFAAGQALSEHRAAMPVIVQIESGEATVTLGADRYELGPGAWMHLRAGLAHSIEAHTPMTMVLTMLQEPKST